VPFKTVRSKLVKKPKPKLKVKVTRKKKVLTGKDIEKKTKLLFFNAWRRVLTRSVLGKSIWDKAEHPTDLGPRGGKTYICSICNKSFSPTQMEIEHSEPVIDLRLNTNIMAWDYIYERINTSNLTLMCKVDHKFKSSFEATERARLKTVMKHMVCRRKMGGDIKVISMVDLRDFDTSKYEVIDVKDTFAEATEEAKRRR